MTAFNAEHIMPEWHGVRQLFRYWNWGSMWALHPSCDWIYIHKIERYWSWPDSNYGPRLKQIYDL